jgi:hypothetical protein
MGALWHPSITHPLTVLWQIPQLGINRESRLTQAPRITPPPPRLLRVRAFQKTPAASPATPLSPPRYTAGSQGQAKFLLPAPRQPSRAYQRFSDPGAAAFQSMGWVSGVAFSSSFHILIVLSACKCPRPRVCTCAFMVRCVCVRARARVHIHARVYTLRADDARICNDRSLNPPLSFLIFPSLSISHANLAHR